MRSNEKEWDKCKKDFIYFCRNYIKINTKDNGIVKFPIKKHQTSLLKNLNKNRLILGVLPRQCGKTTCCLSYALHQAIFHDKLVFFGDIKLDILKEKFYNLKSIIDNLPIWMKNIKSNTITGVSFTGGGKIIGSYVDIQSTRGITIDILILDEFAYVSDERAESFISSMFPTISSRNGKVIILSSSNGKNHFYNMYKKSRKKETGFKVIKKTWKSVGHDPVNMTNMLKYIGKKAFDREYMSKFS